MDLKSIAIFGALGKRMDWLNQRQNLLADNIANADTPKFRGADLKPLSFKQLLQSDAPSLPLRASNARHLAGTVQPMGGFPDAQRSDSYEASPNGNRVVLEEELIKVAETRTAYELASNLYRKYTDMFRLAVSRR